MDEESGIVDQTSTTFIHSVAAIVVQTAFRRFIAIKYVDHLREMIAEEMHAEYVRMQQEKREEHEMLKEAFSNEFHQDAVGELGPSSSKDAVVDFSGEPTTPLLRALRDESLKQPVDMVQSGSFPTKRTGSSFIQTKEIDNSAVDPLEVQPESFVDLEFRPHKREQPIVDPDQWQRSPARSEATTAHSDGLSDFSNGYGSKSTPTDSFFPAKKTQDDSILDPAHWQEQHHRQSKRGMRPDPAGSVPTTPPRDMAREMYELAAIQIQAAFRGFWVRDTIDIDHFCATIIQKIVRGFLLRLASLREKSTERSADFMYEATDDEKHDRLTSAKLATLSDGSKKTSCQNKSVCSRSQASSVSDGAISWQQDLVALSCHARQIGQLGYDASPQKKNKNVAAAEQTLAAKEEQNQLEDRAALLIQCRYRSFVCEMNFIRSLVDILIVQTVVRRWLAKRRVYVIRQNAKDISPD